MLLTVTRCMKGQNNLVVCPWVYRGEASGRVVCCVPACSACLRAKESFVFHLELYTRRGGIRTIVVVPFTSPCSNVQRVGLVLSLLFLCSVVPCTQHAAACAVTAWNRSLCPSLFFCPVCVGVPGVILSDMHHVAQSFWSATSSIVVVYQQYTTMDRFLALFQNVTGYMIAVREFVLMTQCASDVSYRSSTVLRTINSQDYSSLSV